MLLGSLVKPCRWTFVSVDGCISRCSLTFVFLCRLVTYRCHGQAMPMNNDRSYLSMVALAVALERLFFSFLQMLLGFLVNLCWWLTMVRICWWSSSSTLFNVSASLCFSSTGVSRWISIGRWRWCVSLEEVTRDPCRTSLLSSLPVRSFPLVRSQVVADDGECCCSIETVVPSKSLFRSFFGSTSIPGSGRVSRVQTCLWADCADGQVWNRGWGKFLPCHLCGYGISDMLQLLVWKCKVACRCSYCDAVIREGDQIAFVVDKGVMKKVSFFHQKSSPSNSWRFNIFQGDPPCIGLICKVSECLFIGDFSTSTMWKTKKCLNISWLFVRGHGRLSFNKINSLST